MTPLAIERRPEGLYLPSLDLFLDPTAKVGRAYLSHAHADHAGGAESAVVLGTPETLALLDARRDAPLGERSSAVPFGRELDFGPCKVTLEPAGHVLGASQLVVDHAGGRFVYTGDVSLGPARTHAEGKAIPCDELLVESTFGAPIFAWPNRDEELARLVAFCNEAIEGGRRALVLAYSLGKAQELTASLRATGLRPVLHGAAYRVATAYEGLGVDLGIAAGETLAYADALGGARRKKAPAAVVIAPPWSAKALAKSPCDVAFCSGFALVDAHVDRVRADRGFVLSDRASFDELVALVRASGARTITTTHGLAEPLARHLARLGLRASAVVRDAIDAPEDSA